MLEESDFSGIVCRELGLPGAALNIEEWRLMLQKIKQRPQTVHIAVVGKYTKMKDAYLSIIESLHHGGYANHSVVQLHWVEAEECTDKTAPVLFKECTGILVPGGFGQRGIEGKIAACQFARTHNIPFLGICLGMQIAVIEFARNILFWQDANSTEFNRNTGHPVIDLMPDQTGKQLGGTMRLGRYSCQIKNGTKLHSLYRTPLAGERHRHRYEFNNIYLQEFTRAGLTISGTSPDNLLVEAIELKEHPFFIGVQFHPEFKSRPNKPHPLFAGFIAQALQTKTDFCTTKDSKV